MNNIDYRITMTLVKKNNGKKMDTVYITAQWNSVLNTVLNIAFIVKYFFKYGVRFCWSATEAYCNILLPPLQTLTQVLTHFLAEIGSGLRRHLS